MNVPADWLSVARLRQEPSADPAVAGVVRWIVEVVGRPDPGIGRSGFVCPFVPPSLARNALWLKTSPLGADDDAIAEALLAEIEAFRAAAPNDTHPDRIYKALVYAFPLLPGAESPILQRVRSRVKPYFLEARLTCGEFYPHSDDRSVRNAAFPVARSPVPAVAIRYLTPHDELFLRSQPELFEIFQRVRGDGSG